MAAFISFESVDFSGNVLPQNKIPSEIFSNNELQLGEIEVYGFDYDYTIACYNDSLNRLIYNLGRTNLINEYKVSLTYCAFISNNLGVSQQSMGMVFLK